MKLLPTPTGPTSRTCSLRARNWREKAASRSRRSSVMDADQSKSSRRQVCSKPALPRYLRHRQPGVVVEDGLGHPAQEGGGQNVAVQKRLCSLRRAGLHEAVVAVGQVLPPAARRQGVGQHLAHRVPVQAEHPRRLPDALAFDHHHPADPQIYVHFEHLSAYPEAQLPTHRWRRTVHSSTATSQRPTAHEYQSLRCIASR